MTTSQDPHWGSDGPVSRPVGQSTEYPSLVEMGGFGFSENGLTFHATESEIDVFMTPHFMPPLRIEGIVDGK